MSLIPLGFWAASGAGAVAYWIASLGDTVVDRFYSVATDSNGNTYSAGHTNSEGEGNLDLLLAKYDSLGAIQWQRILGGAVGDDAKAVAVDSNDDVYVAGMTASEGEGNTDLLLAKYNSSGVIQWQRILGGSVREITQAMGIDSSDNIYVSGYTNSQGAGDYDFLIAKYNSSGVIQWQRILGGASNDQAYGLAFDSSDNLYVSGNAPFASTFILAKYNSSGVIQWQKTLSGAGGELFGILCSDSSDNIYLGGGTSSEGAGDYDLILVKYNSAGIVQWQRILGGTGFESVYDLTADSSDNVYVLGTTESTGDGSTDFVIAKYNSSGVIQWQRVLGTSGNENGWGISVDLDGNLFVNGYTDSVGEGSVEALIAKLPSDGSLTGTYVLDGVDVIYAASTFTAATIALTEGSGSLTGATSTLTAATSTLTAATSTLTSHIVEL